MAEKQRPKKKEKTRTKTEEEHKIASTRATAQPQQQHSWTRSEIGSGAGIDSGQISSGQLRGIGSPSRSSSSQQSREPTNSSLYRSFSEPDLFGPGYGGFDDSNRSWISPQTQRSTQSSAPIPSFLTSAFSARPIPTSSAGSNTQSFGVPSDSFWGTGRESSTRHTVGADPPLRSWYESGVQASQSQGRQPTKPLPQMNTDELWRQFGQMMATGSRQTVSDRGQTQSQSAGQTEPSVRPKVRSAPPAYPVMGTPETDLVRNFRDDSGMPSTAKLKRVAALQRSLRPTSPERLAMDSRLNINEMKRFDRRKSKRMVQYLKDRDYTPDSEGRFHPDSAQRGRTALQDRRILVPGRESDRKNFSKATFNRPQAQIEWVPTRPEYTPIGRQGWGPPKGYTQSESDLSRIGQTEEPDEGQNRRDWYRQRYESLKKKYKNAYLDYKRSIDWDSNPNALARMVKPPTTGYIGIDDKQALKRIHSQTREQFSRPIAPVDNREEQRRERIQQMELRAKLKPSMEGDAYKALLNISQPIGEVEEEDEESDEENDE